MGERATRDGRLLSTLRARFCIDGPFRLRARFRLRHVSAINALTRRPGRRVEGVLAKLMQGASTSCTSFSDRSTGTCAVRGVPASVGIVSVECFLPVINKRVSNCCGIRGMCLNAGGKGLYLGLGLSSFVSLNDGQAPVCHVGVRPKRLVSGSLVIRLCRGEIWGRVVM